MLGIGKKDEQGRQVRVEHRGKHLRASRTGGVSLRAQAEAAGLNFTVNSSHGSRISRRIAKGTNVFLQRGRLRLRGRYGSGATKLNLSKGGMSLSTRNRIGTINLTNPGRSSAKVMGVQMRGKNAVRMQVAYFAVTAIVAVIRFVFALIVNGFVFVIYAAEGGARLLLLGGRRASEAASAAWTSLGELRSRQRNRRLIGNAAEETGIDIRNADYAETVIVVLLALRARGVHSAGPDEHEAIAAVYADNDSQARQSWSREKLETIAADVDQAFHGSHESTRRLRQLEDAVFVQAVRTLAGARDSRELLAFLFLLDDLCLRLGERTRRQEELLDVYCEQTGITVEPTSRQ